MILYSLEAEEGVLGYLLNAQVTSQEKKTEILDLESHHFGDERYSKIFSMMKKYELFDTILLLHKSHELNEDIDNTDLMGINNSVSRAIFIKYKIILFDKKEKREIYNLGNSIKERVGKGIDQYDIILETVNYLMKFSSTADVKDTKEIIDDVIEERTPPVITSGYEEIDKKTGGFLRGNVNTLGGESGQMKTTFSIDMVLRILEKDTSLRGAIFSKEMPDSDIIKKIMCRNLEIEMKDITTQNYNKKLAKQFRDEYEPFDRLTIVDPDQFNNASDISRIQLRNKYDFWVVDFVQLLEGDNNKSATSASDMNMQVVSNMKTLKKLSIMTMSVGILLSQLKKGVDSRTIMRPKISDLEWSGVIKQLSAYILFSYYPYEYYKNKEIAPMDHYYLLAEKTRYSGNFSMPMKVDGRYGTFKVPDSMQEKLEMLNKIKGL